MTKTKFKKNILGIGAGHVGGPTMTIIANKCPDYKVTVVDISQSRIDAWNSDQLPFFEPGLKERVDRVRGKNLFFSTEIDREIDAADIIFVSVNTPTKPFGLGAGKAADLQYVEKTARRIQANSRSDKIIVEKSTVPVRAAETLGRILHSGDRKVHFEILSNPEFLAEGSAIRDMENPDRILIGAMDTPSGKKALEELTRIYLRWVSPEKLVTTNLWSSELSKLVSNAFLAQRISSINSIASLCELTGANISDVSEAVGRDARVGGKFLQAGVGYGGSCFRKDLLSLVYLCEYHGLHDIAQYWQQVNAINDYQMEWFVNRITHAMFNTLVDKKIAIFGFAFKPNTGDTRDAPAYYICKRLAQEKAKLCITDPHALDNARIDLKGMEERVTLEPDPYKAAENAHAVVLITEWDSFKTLDYKRIFDSMEKPAFIFDGRNLLNSQELFQMGFNVYPVGKSSLHHF